MDKYLIRKVLVFLVGAFIYATGITIVKVCYLGMSPVTSVPFVISLISGITLGSCTVYYNFVFYLIQKLVMKKEYTLKKFIIQVILSFVFGVMIDATGGLFGGFVPQQYPVRICYLIFGCFVLATGMTGVVLSDFGVLPAEGTALCIKKVTGLDFGYCKIALDVMSVIIAVILSLIFLGGIQGTREGTLISAILVGLFAKQVGRVIGKPVECFLHPQNLEGTLKEAEERIEEEIV